MSWQCAARLTVFGALGELGAVGCTTAPVEPSVGNPAGALESPSYWERRRDEFARSFECTLLVGPGLGARATATRFVQAGLLVLGPTDRQSMVAPLPERQVGLRDGEMRSESLRTLEYGLSPWYSSDALLFDGADRGSWRGDLAATRGTEFSAQLHLGLLGASLGFDPVAFGELLFGIVGWE